MADEVSTIAGRSAVIRDIGLPIVHNEYSHQMRAHWVDGTASIHVTMPGLDKAIILTDVVLSELGTFLAEMQAA